MLCYLLPTLRIPRLAAINDAGQAYNFRFTDFTVVELDVSKHTETHPTQTQEDYKMPFTITAPRANDCVCSVEAPKYSHL